MLSNKTYQRFWYQLKTPVSKSLTSAGTWQGHFVKDQRKELTVGCGLFASAGCTPPLFLNAGSDAEMAFAYKSAPLSTPPKNKKSGKIAFVMLLLRGTPSI